MHASWRTEMAPSRFPVNVGMGFIGHSFPSRPFAGNASPRAVLAGASLGNPDIPLDIPETGSHGWFEFDDLPVNIVANRWANRDVAEIMQLSFTATPEEVEAAGMIDLIFGVPPRFAGHGDELDCPGRMPRECPADAARCPSSTFMCPVPPMSKSDYPRFFPIFSAAYNPPARFLGLDSRRTIRELRPSIENTLRLYAALGTFGRNNSTWMWWHRGPLSEVARSDVAMPSSFIDMEVALISSGASFTLTGLGVPSLLPIGVEITFTDVAIALAQLLTADELLQMSADLDVLGGETATGLRDAIDDVIAGGVPIPDDGVPIPDVPYIPPPRPPDEPVPETDSTGLLVGGGILALVVGAFALG